MWLVFVVQAALACTPAATVTGFDGWVDGAVDVPTDARMVTLADMHFAVTVTRVDTGEIVATVGDPRALDMLGGTSRIAHDPVTELAPLTEYRADVADYEGNPYSATFTTGAGPTAGGFDAPVLSDVSHTAWESSDGSFICTIGNPVRERTVGGTLDVPDGLPVGSYVAIRSESRLTTFAYVAPAASGAIEILQGEHDSSSDEKFERHDCLTPVLILPSGEEISGDTTCIEHAKGLGCATGGGGGSWVLAAVAVLGLAGGRRR